MKKRIAILVAASIAAIGGTASASPSENSVSLMDPTGDADVNPDLTTVSVGNDGGGTITFRIGIGNRETLGQGDEVAIIINSDDDMSTGDRVGIDHVINVYPEGPKVRRWTGDGFHDAHVQIEYAYELGIGFAVVLNRRDLGNTARFSFWVRAWGTDDPDVFDDAPDGDDLWSYPLRLPFGLTIVTPELPFDFVDKTPKAGKPFLLAMRIRRDDTGATLTQGKIVCTARLAGKQLATKQGRFFGILVSDVWDRTQATCSWSLPRSARGKRFVAQISVTFRGVTVRRTFAGVVR